MGVKTGVGWQLVAGRTVSDHAGKVQQKIELGNSREKRERRKRRKEKNEGVLGCSSAGPEIKTQLKKNYTHYIFLPHFYHLQDLLF